MFANLSRRVPHPCTFRRDDRCVRVVRLANYVAPASGGLRTALAELGGGYLAAGHDPVLVVPGSRPERQQTGQGLVITVPGVPVPGTGGYRAITARRSLRRLLEDLQPDRLEVSDRTTLRWTGAWARRCGIRSMMVSHDSLAALAQMFRPPGLSVRQLVDRLNSVRNRVAHHEPIHCLNIAARHGEVLLAASWIDPAAAAWIAETSRVTGVLEMRPAAGPHACGSPSPIAVLRSPRDRPA